MCDPRNYLPVCSKHQYKGDPIGFNQFKFMKEHAPGLYETMSVLENKGRAFQDDAILWGYDQLKRFYAYDSGFTDYMSEQYGFLWKIIWRGDFYKKKER